MGKSSGKVPSAPNLQQNIGNANQTYQTATNNATQTFNTANAYNQNAQNTLANVTGAEAPMTTAVNNSANQNLQQYGSTFTPLQQQQAQQAQNYTSNQNVQQLQGQAVANSNAANQAALQNSRAALASEGVDPASVHGGALMQQAAVQGAAQNAGAATNSYLQTQATGAQLVNQANQLGLQVGAQGTTQAGVGSGIAAQTVANTNQTNASGINNLTAANTYLNTGTSANNSAVNASSAQFQDALAQYNAQQQASASGLGALGGLAGAALGAAGNAGGFGQLLHGMDGGPVPGYAGGGAIPKPGMPPMTSLEPRSRMTPIPHIPLHLHVPHLAGGGVISPKGALPHPIVPGTTDTKLIAATPGEFMLPKDVTEYMGHEKLHNLIDKTREKISQRHGLPPQLSSAHTSVGA